MANVTFFLCRAMHHREYATTQICLASLPPQPLNELRQYKEHGADAGRMMLSYSVMIMGIYVLRLDRNEQDTTK